MDTHSLTYAQACQKIIDLQTKGAFPTEEACEKLIAIPMEDHLHPMLGWVEQYAHDIFYAYDEDQDIEKYWEELQGFVGDYLAGKWRTTT
jgi:hypothetical protein